MTGAPADAPRLVDEAGGPDIVLAARLLTFGSARDCGLRLSGKGVPERLGHFLYRGGGYELQPAVPGDAVRVNGRGIDRPVALAPGDRVSLGDRVFRYQAGGSAAARAEDSSGGAANPLGGILQALSRLLRDRDPDVFTSLVVSVSGLFRCDAARIVEEPASGERRTLARFPQGSGLERFSNRAIDWARDSDSAVLANEEDWDSGGQDSLRRNAVGSVLCVALREEGSIVGYLYLDRTKGAAPFERSDQALCDALKPLLELILARRREAERQRETIARFQSAGQGVQGGIVYSGQAMAKAMETARRAAQTDAPVLVHGETGTGKELLARFIHSQSERAHGPFVALNCGAIPENLVESELFGHEKGAFTGADRRKPGLFESAQGGTVFLDEIGELPAAVQVKLLRVLQESEVRRVGGEETLSVDVRILAATHRDLAREVQAGRFRQDLYFRLSVLGVTLPPLRERGEDILLLAGFLLQKYLVQFGRPQKAFSRAAQDRLMRHPFPGNIRELENVIQKAIIMSDAPEIELEDLEGGLQPAAGPAGPGEPAGEGSAATLREARTSAERKVIAEALALTSGNVSAAAKRLDVDRKWLMKLMQEYGLDADSYRKQG